MTLLGSKRDRVSRLGLENAPTQRRGRTGHPPGVLQSDGLTVGELAESTAVARFAALYGAGAALYSTGKVTAR